MRRLILVVLAALGVTLCTPAAVVPQHDDHAVVWPAPPQRARIAFLYSVAKEADAGVERSLLRRLWDWLIGAQDEGGFLVRPLGVAVDGRGRLYVTDPGGHCVHIFDRGRKDYRVITAAGSEELQTPVAVAFAGDGRTYISDSELKAVLVYGDDGNFRSAIEGPFERPTGVAVLHDRLYVVDTARNEIFVFTLDGTLLFHFGSRGNRPGQFNFPSFLAADRSLYLTDGMNHRVQVLDDSGNAQLSFGAVGGEPGTFTNPKGIAVDGDGQIYVADALFDAFQIFDPRGALLLVVGGPGRETGEFDMPAGMCIDRDNKVYVVDALNSRVQVFQYLR